MQNGDHFMACRLNYGRWACDHRLYDRPQNKLEGKHSTTHLSILFEVRPSAWLFRLIGSRCGAVLLFVAYNLNNVTNQDPNTPLRTLREGKYTQTKPWASAQWKPYHRCIMRNQGWRVLDGTRFLPRYLPVNTVLGKTGFGHPKWGKPGKTQLRSFFKQFNTWIKDLIGPWNV